MWTVVFCPKVGFYLGNVDASFVACGYTYSFTSVDTSLLWTLFVWPLAVHISEVLLYLGVHWRYLGAQNASTACPQALYYLTPFICMYVHTH